MGMSEAIYLFGGIVIALAAIVGGAVMAAPTLHDLRLARGFFLIAGTIAAAIAVTFGVTSPVGILWRTIAVGVFGALIGPYFYVMVTWINAKIRSASN